MWAERELLVWTWFRRWSTWNRRPRSSTSLSVSRRPLHQSVGSTYPFPSLSMQCTCTYQVIPYWYIMYMHLLCICSLLFVFTIILLCCLQVLIFSEKKAEVDDIHEYLLLKGVQAVSIHGGRGTMWFYAKLIESIADQLQHIDQIEGAQLIIISGQLMIWSVVSWWFNQLIDIQTRRSVSGRSGSSRRAGRTCWWQQTWPPRGWTSPTYSTSSTTTCPLT